MTSLSETLAQLAKEQARRDAEDRKKGVPLKPFATVEPGEAQRARAEHEANKAKLEANTNTTQEAV